MIASQSDVEEFPAKSRTTIKDGNEARVPGIGIVQHGCIAAEVLRRILYVVKTRGNSGLLPDELAVVAALHDIGKANPYFLRKLLNACSGCEEQFERMSRDADPQIDETPHSFVSYAALLDMGAARSCANIAARHHGYKINSTIPNSESECFGGRSWAEFRKRISDEILKRSKLQAVFPRLQRNALIRSTQEDLWTGLVVLSDWIASAEDAEIPRGSESDAGDKLASTAGFKKLRMKEDLSFEDIFGFKARSTQRLLIDAYSGPGIYVLEAPTGCGKTEAALALAFKAIKAGDACGVYFALPSQLASNKLHERVEQAVRRLYDENADVKLSHSGAYLHSIKIGKEASPGGIWHSSSRLSLLAPFGVGTVDQALLAVLNTKFHEVRLAGLCGKVVILDEVHSYDEYTLELISMLVRAVEAMGGVVVVLSATLTCSGLRRIVGSDGVAQSMKPAALTVKTKNGLVKKELSEVDPHPVYARLLEGESSEEEAFKEAVERVRMGMQVIWVENTVSASQRIYEKAKAEGLDAGLLHSRFRVMDREENESKWSGVFGRGGLSDRGRSGRLLVGTQVLEQSLDLDADFMVTRHAPVDLLIQRLGRLWRHADVKRPDGCSRAQAWILACSASVDGVNYGGRFGKSELIYHPYILHRSLDAIRKMLAESEVLMLPDASRELLESAYCDRCETDEQLEILKKDLHDKNEKLKNCAKGALSSPIDLTEAAATRLSTIPSHEVVMLSESDSEVLASCSSREQMAMEIEKRIVDSPRRLTNFGVAPLLEKCPPELRGWLCNSKRYKDVEVCFYSPDGVVKGDGARLKASYSEDEGLKFLD